MSDDYLCLSYRGRKRAEIEDRVYKEDQFALLKFLGVFALICSPYLLLAFSNPSPEVKGNKPVVSSETIVSKSWGYDFNNDGSLDYGIQWIGGGRVPVVSVTLPKESLSFKILEEEYSKVF